MPQSINNTLSGLAGLRQLSQTQTNLDNALAKIASGNRINSAADDAAGLAIANRLTSQINGLNTASRNANDGISYAQVTESALEESTNALQRIRDLSLQAANGTLNPSDRNAIQQEIDQLKGEIDRIAETTTFNGRNVLDGSESTTIQIGPNREESVSIEGFDASASALGNDSSSVADIDVSTAQLAQSAASTVDDALNRIDSYRASIGAIQNRFESSIRNLSAVAESQSAARSRIADTDFASQITELSREQIKRQAGLALQAQANALSQQVLSLLN